MSPHSAGTASLYSFIIYDYPFSTTSENAVNKRMIERRISSRLRRKKIYADRLKFCKTTVFVMLQPDNHVIFYTFISATSSETPLASIMGFTTFSMNSSTCWGHLPM